MGAAVALEGRREWKPPSATTTWLFAFPEVAQLAAFVRTDDAHDLGDHPAWPVVTDLTVAELTPEEAQRYDIIGVPELAAEDTDQWTVGELAEIVGMVRSIAEVCDLEVVEEVLDSAPGFALLDQGTLPFVGREGGKLWQQLVDTIAERWDDVIDALDDLVTTPRVDMAALAAAEKEAEVLAAQQEADALVGDDDGVDDRELDALEDDLDDDDRDDLPDADAVADRPLAEADEQDDEETPDDEPEPTFWEQVGIDPIRIVTGEGELLTLRCYLDDRPIFLGADGEIDTFPTRGALMRFVADGSEGNDMATVSTWADVVERAAARELEIEVDPLNVYVLPGLDDDIAEGPLAVDPTQLEQAVELVRDVADWAGDDAPREALAESQSLGWLVSFVTRPDPTRMAPSPPFDADAAKWRELVDDLEKRLIRR